MWVIGTYESVTLFSLKSALATSSGGKSLLVPTPYALKMALLDAGYRVQGAAGMEALWPTIRDLDIALTLPEWIVVSNAFTRILKLRRGAPSEGDIDAGPFQHSIGFREYVSYKGLWRLAIGTQTSKAIEALRDLLLQVNYLGKRGGFVQIVDLPVITEALPESFTRLNPRTPPETFQMDGTLQVLDDCGPQMTLLQADIYSGAKIGLGKERLLNNVVLPCRLMRSSRGYSLYERMDG